MTLTYWRIALAGLAMIAATNAGAQPPDMRPGRPPVDPAGCSYESVGDLFIVFFDLDSATIGPDAAEILNNAATLYAHFPLCRVRIVGHADRSGDPAYNLDLSRRRAHAVSDYLRAHGVGSSFVYEAFGDTRPLVDTPPGVREHENRRAEILIEPPNTPH